MFWISADKIFRRTKYFGMENNTSRYLDESAKISNIFDDVKILLESVKSVIFTIEI